MVWLLLYEHQPHDDGNRVGFTDEVSVPRAVCAVQRGPRRCIMQAAEYNASPLNRLGFYIVMQPKTRCQVREPLFIWDKLPAECPRRHSEAPSYAPVSLWP